MGKRAKTGSGGVGGLVVVGAVVGAAGAAGRGLVFAGGGGGGRAVVVLIVGFVEAGALEDDAGANADQALDLAVALGAGLDRLGGDGLEFFKVVAAFLAFVFVGRHSSFPPKRAEAYSSTHPETTPKHDQIRFPFGWRDRRTRRGPLPAGGEKGGGDRACRET